MDHISHFAFNFKSRFFSISEPWVVSLSKLRRPMIPNRILIQVFTDTASYTDTTRRSGRATKGQHSKLAEVEDTPPAPKRGNSTKKSKKNEPTPEPEEEGDPSDYIRCVCGYVEEDDDDERKMISCDQCQAWQHNICMDMSEDESVLPKEYYCEQCHPQDHQKLLDQIQRGEKPWVERNLRREEEEEAQKKGRKKKGKRGGRRGRPSEAQKNEGQQNGAIDSAVEEAPSKPEEEQQPAEVAQTPQTPIEKESNNKRKFPDEAAIEAQSPGQAVKLVAAESINVER